MTERKTLTLPPKTKESKPIPDPLQTSVEVTYKYDKRLSKKQKLARRPPPASDFNPSKVRNPDEMYWAQMLKKQKKINSVNKWKNSLSDRYTIYSEGRKIGKFAIFKIIPDKPGAFFVSLHNEFEDATTEANRLRKSIRNRHPNLEFCLYITEIRHEYNEKPLTVESTPK